MPEAIFTVAWQRYDCPRCNQIKGNHCRTPKGRLVASPHMERTQLVRIHEPDVGRVPIDRRLLEDVLAGKP